MKRNYFALSGLVILSMLLTGLTFNPSRPADQARTTWLNTPPRWDVATLGASFAKVDTVSASEGWALTFEGQLYQLRAGSWQLTPILGDAVINDVAAISANDSWAVGYRPSIDDESSDGAIWHLAGDNWQLVSSPNSGGLHLIDMVSNSVGWATGERVTLRYLDSTWQVVASGDSVPHLTDISAVSASELWGVGPEGIYRFDGSSWQHIDPDPGLRAIAMTGDVGWVVGVTGKIRRFDGASWGEPVFPAGANLHDVAINSTDDAWAVGDQGTILHFTGGDASNWSQVAAGLTGEALRSISLPTAGTGWIGGNQGGLFNYNGGSWVNQSLAVQPEILTVENLNSLDALAANDVWAVGGDINHTSLILHSDGTAWTIDHTNPVTQSLRAINMVSPGKGWAVGGNDRDGTSVILELQNGVWTVDPTNPAAYPLATVDMLNETEGWAAGGDFSHFAHGVIIQYSGSGWQLNNIPETASTIKDLDMFDSSTGWAVGAKNTLLRYTGAGSWQSEPLDTGGLVYDLEDIQMVSATEAWAVGTSINERGLQTGLILHYQNNSWQTVPVANASLTGTELRGLSMLSADEGWAVGEHGEFLYYSAGTWQEVAEFLSVHLNNIQMIDSNTGWSVGSGGVIMQAGSISGLSAAQYLTAVSYGQETNGGPQTNTNPSGPISAAGNFKMYFPMISKSPEPVTPKVVYYHSFEDDEAGGWPTAPTFGSVGGDCDSYVESGTYVVYIYYDSEYRCLRPAPDEANYRYGAFESVDYRADGSHQVDYGLYLNGRGGGEYYLFRISPENPCSWDFVKRRDNHDDQKQYGDCDNINGGANRVRVEHTRENDYDVFGFFVNDQRVGEYIEPHAHALVGDGTGFFAEARDYDQAEIHFDYFQVLSLP